MAAPISSFVQFQRCDLCRRNHTQKWKHVYSKKHQEIVKNILDKFKKKIKAAQEDLYVPHVEAENWEVGARCWCYFCRTECEKHERVGNVTLRNSGFLQHLAQNEHKTSTEEFWKVNRIESKKINAFLLEEQQIKRFHARAEEVIKKYLEKIATSTKQKAAEFHHQAEMRARLVQHVRYETYAQAQAQMTKVVKLNRDKQKSFGAGSRVIPQQTRGDLGPVRTVAAHGEGLTCIKLPDEKDTSITGNVHSGAMPPWMVDDSEADDGIKVAQVGPSQADLVEIERKRKLPATRVGAKFNHHGATSATWLPSFGRVWNNQRRMNSRQQFEKSEWNMGRKAMSIPSNKPPPSATLTKAQYDAMQGDLNNSTASGDTQYNNPLGDGNIQLNVQQNHTNPTEVQSASSIGMHSHGHPAGDQGRQSMTPRVHPYRRKQSNFLSQVPSLQIYQQRNINSLPANSSSYQGYNGYINSSDHTHSRAQNTRWYGGNQSHVGNNRTVDSSANSEIPQRPTFQRIKLSSKFLK